MITRCFRVIALNYRWIYFFTSYLGPGFMFHKKYFVEFRQVINISTRDCGNNKDLKHSCKSKYRFKLKIITLLDSQYFPYQVYIACFIDKLAMFLRSRNEHKFRKVF